MEVTTKPIHTLANDPNNARTHNNKNLEAIKGSLAKFGQQKPIVVNSSNVVIAGNGTLQAARELGWNEIDCVVTELDDLNQAAFGLADNKTAELADWDLEQLGSTLDSLAKVDFDVSAIGFDDVLGEAIDEVDFPTLDDGPKSEMCQITYTLHESQAEIVKEAVDKMIEMNAEHDLNTNKNGNGIFYICESFLQRI